MPLKDKDAHRAYCRAYATEHAIEANQRATAHYHANKDAINLRRRTDPEYRRRNISRSIKFRTGSDLETKERLLAEQKEKCACCGDELQGPRDRCLDHDHKTGAVRSVLCAHCNTALGMVDDDPVRLRKLIAYLRKHRSAQSSQ